MRYLYGTAPDRRPIRVEVRENNSRSRRSLASLVDNKASVGEAAPSKQSLRRRKTRRSDVLRNCSGIIIKRIARVFQWVTEHDGRPGTVCVRIDGCFCFRKVCVFFQTPPQPCKLDKISRQSVLTAEQQESVQFENSFLLAGKFRIS